MAESSSSFSSSYFCEEAIGGSGTSSSDGDLDDCDDEPGPSVAKKAKRKLKYSGAYKYKSSFSKDWTKTWSFITAVPGDQHSFQCTLCSKTLSCSHQGVSDVKTHIAGKTHQRIGSQMSKQSQLSFASRTNPLSDKVSWLLAFINFKINFFFVSIGNTS